MHWESGWGRPWFWQPFLVASDQLLSYCVSFRYLSGSSICTTGNSIWLDLVRQVAEQELGFGRFGYMLFFLEQDPCKLMNTHVRLVSTFILSSCPVKFTATDTEINKTESIFSLMYGSEEDSAKKLWLFATLHTSLRENCIAPPPTWQAPIYISTLPQIFFDSSFRSPRSWYRCCFGQILGI